PSAISLLSLHDALPIYHSRRLFLFNNIHLYMDCFLYAPYSSSESPCCLLFIFNVVFYVSRNKRGPIIHITYKVPNSFNWHSHIQDRKSTRLNSSHVSIS